MQVNQFSFVFLYIRGITPKVMQLIFVILVLGIIVTVHADLDQCAYFSVLSIYPKI